MVARKYAKKRDGNEAGIVTALSMLGAVVVRLDGAAGLPDLLVGYDGATVLMEVKDPEQASKRGKSQRISGGLDPDQVKWHTAWRGGPCVVVETVQEAIEAAREAAEGA